MASVSPAKSNDINIVNANILAMHRAIDMLEKEPEFLLIDGNRFKKYKNIPHATIVKGDGKYMSIAAASILAKTYRDAYMRKLHGKFPYYGWDHNKGYPTLQHKLAIREHGNCIHHRKTFRSVIQTRLEF